MATPNVHVTQSVRQPANSLFYIPHYTHHRFSAIAPDGLTPHIKGA